MNAPRTIPADRGYMGDPARGASLGRRDRGAPSDEPAAFSVQRVNIDSQGYDDGGAYWGTGEPLFWAATADGETERFFRAANRAAAESTLKEEFPAAVITWSPADLDDFAAAYVQALFFTESAPQVGADEFETAEHQEAMREGTADGRIPDYLSAADLAPETLESIVADCARFQRDNAETLALAYERDGYSVERAGHDFWLTRNRHGAGFWDRDELDGDDLGRRLTAAAEGFGEADSWFENGKVHLS